MKKSFVIIVACCAFALALGLAGCGGSSSGSAASGSASGASSAAASSASASASAVASSAASSSAASSESSALESVYEEKAHEMESAKNDFLNTLKNDAENFPKEMAEGRNSVINDDVEFMTKNIKEIYDSGVERLNEIGGAATDVQAYKDKLAELRDTCLIDIEKAADELRA